MFQTRLVSRRWPQRGEAVPCACPPSPVPPLLEPLEPRLLLANILTISPCTLPEGNSGTTPFVFHVTLTRTDSSHVTVNYSTTDGTATVADNDYVAIPQTLLDFGTDGTAQDITVSVKGDTKLEPDEYFFVNLTSLVNATYATPPGSQVKGTIQNDDYPTASIATTTAQPVNEGAQGTTTPVTFTVTLSAAYTQPVTVQYWTVNGTGIGGTDYEAIPQDPPQTLTFNAGDTTKKITANIIGNNIANQGDRTFNVQIGNASPSVIQITTPQAMATIKEDDAALVTIDDAAVTEGDPGASGPDAVFHITLSRLSATDVSVQAATAPGTAKAGSDFVSTSANVTIPAMQSSVDFHVPIVSDLKHEPTQTFTVTLSSPTNAQLGAKKTGTGTILDNDPVPTVSIVAGASITEGNSGTKNLDFTVTLSAASEENVTVNYATRAGTATSGNDYTALDSINGSDAALSISANSTTGKITVKIRGDTNWEPDETFYLDLLPPVTGAAIDQNNKTAVGTILNDDKPSLSINNASLVEGNSGLSDMVFTVTLQTPLSEPVTVQYLTQNNTATAGQDYVAISPAQTLTFDPGVTSMQIRVSIIGDEMLEDNETFYVKLQNPSSNVQLASGGQGVGTIINDDTPPTVSFAGDPSPVNEGDVGAANPINFTVSLSETSLQAVTVNWATSDGTAIAGTDYTAASGIATINPGTLSTTVTVYTIGDLVDEPDKTFTVTLTGPSGATLGAKPTATGTVKDDDIAILITIDNVSVTEGDEGTTVPAVFNVTLSAPSTYTVTVHWATQAGTATAGTDFTSASGDLTFGPGETAKTVTVTVIGDDLSEDNETFNVNLSSPTSATIAKGTGVATILNDDAPLPTISINDVQALEGNAGTTDFVFTVSLSAPSGLTVTVDFATQAGTATAETDYISTSGSLTFNPGETTRTIIVAVEGDTNYERDETFSVVLSNVANALMADDRGVGMILNDDAPADVLVDLVGQWGGIAINSVVVGNYAYVCQGPALHILNIADPTRPVEVGSRPLPGTAESVAVSGNLAYVADDWDGLQIIDVSNPAVPIRLGGCDTTGAVDVYVSGNVAYVADGYAGLQIIDVSNPPAPVRRGGYDTNGYAYGVFFCGNLAYVADYEAGLQIIDVSNPAAPVRLGGYDTSGHAHDVFVCGNMAYVADSDAGLQIIDVSNPAAPVWLGGYHWVGDAYGVSVSGNLAYVADGEAGLQMIDVSNPAAPVWRGGYDTTGYAQDVTVSGNLAYVADYGAGLQIIDVSNPAAPVRRGGYNTCGNAFDVFVSSNLAYLVDGSAGLQIIEVSNPAAPVWRGEYNTTGHTYAVRVSGNLAYVADYDAGLQIIDVSNPAAPVRRGGYDTSGNAQGVFISGNLAYVADDWAGLQIIDVSNPAAPVRRGGYDTTGRAWDVFVSGNLAYVADGSAGLQIIDVSNPAAPVRRGGYTTGGADDVFISGNLAYVTDTFQGLQIIDVSNPAAPVRLGGYDTSAYASHVFVSGNLAYVTEREDSVGGLQIIDVSNPAAPVLRGGCHTGNYAYGLFVSGDLAYVAEDEGGLVILKIAATSAWAGTVDDRWENGANWSAGTVPLPVTTARIDGAAARQPVMEQDETVWGLDLAAGATLTFAPGTPKTLVTKGLTIAESGGVPTARLDLASGRLIVDYDDGAASPLADVRRWLAAGCAGMTWTGSGIRSSVAAANPMTYGLGYAQNDMLSPPYDVFSGVPVDSSTILVKYTYLGDLNLVGKVGDNDVTIMVLNYGVGWKPGKPAGPANWQMGDVARYDGKVDDNDITLMALNYGAGWKPGRGAPLGGAPGAAELPTAAPEVLMTPDVIPSAPLVEDADLVGYAQATRARQAALGSAQAAGEAGAAPAMVLAQSEPYQGSAFLPGSGTSGADDPPLVFLAAASAPLAWSTAEEVAPLPGAALSPDGGLDLLGLPALVL